MDKRLFWAGPAKSELKRFPADARRSAGYQLWLVQQGRDPDDWKPLPDIGIGVREIRLHSRLEHRVLYIARFNEGIYVLHAFEKKSRKTPLRSIELARNRLRDVIRSRPPNVNRPGDHP